MIDMRERTFVPCVIFKMQVYKIIFGRDAYCVQIIGRIAEYGKNFGGIRKNGFAILPKTMLFCAYAKTFVFLKEKMVDFIRVSDKIIHN